ncbi:unannotated protein [freshwater metagenome]|uniref:Unannotated protein n=1 Tax=freshwater metagenome TaxID=449393 RepID=A0A6J7FI53_9ZZZZ|nr:phosphatidylinositol kinase [Actinomycetota bacterium]
MITKNRLIDTGELVIKGRLVDASNATLLAHIKDSDPIQQVIYKPVAGERPLWDFQDGDLASREYSAYLISDIAGLNLVPYTALRDGPFGVGMVQQWINIDENIDVVEFGQSSDPQLRKLALFDAIINNTDRKYGHLLVDSSGVLKGCDHGVSFHSDDKLRTVLWQFASLPFDSDELALLHSINDLALEEMFSEYLTVLEITALRQRLVSLASTAKFPEPNNQWPAVPWPPV